jgi:chloramphenicol 3-O-phosphotransferase
MIIMLNGAFGAGKSTVAQLLQARIPNAFTFDPEILGRLSRMLTQEISSAEEQTDDFQDIRVWPPLVAATGCEMYRAYRRPMIVPMTLADPARLATIRSGFEAVAPVAHFCLLASWPTIQARLNERGDGPGSWPWRKSEAYAPAFFDPAYAVHIDTEQRAPHDIAAEIMQRSERNGATT